MFAELQYIFDQLKRSNSLSIVLQANLIDIIKNNRPDLRDFTLTLNFKLINAWQALRQDSNTHPMWQKMSLQEILADEVIKDDLKSIEMSYKNIQTSARLLAQAHRTRAFFRSKPVAVLMKIASCTKDNGTFSAADAQTIAYNHFCKPPRHTT